MSRFFLFLILLFTIQDFSFSHKLFSSKYKLKVNNKRGSSKSFGISRLFSLLFDLSQKEIITLSDQDLKYDNKEDEIEEKFTTKEGKILFIPKSKKNNYESINQGEGPSAYFFDFLDPLFQFEISYEFKRTFQSAKNLPYDPRDDPYSYDKIISYSHTYNHFDLLQKITQHEKDIWDNSITVPQIRMIIDYWGWTINAYRRDEAKYFVDKYDYNGDGRLNSREFILGMIVENLNYIGGKYSCRYCLEHIISNKIDIMFKYLNNNKSSFITAEQIWNGFQHLKRGSNSNFFSLYSCQKYRNVRTIAVNDFVLKAHDSFNGKLSNRDFRLGILLGYWNRQTDDKGIYLEDELNGKSNRWTPAGVDIHCNSIDEVNK